MIAERFATLTGRYRGLRVGVVGDFFLDRYLHIDPTKSEISIETGLEVHNVVEVRSQPGAAGTIVNNLVALGIGEIHVLGFCGDDGEGYELRRALASQPGVKLDHLLTTAQRRTPVYCKPLIIEPGKPPRELNRLDSKNWTVTPAPLQNELAKRAALLASEVDVLLLLEQVDRPHTGVVCPPVMEAAFHALRERPNLVILADSRQGLRHFPPMAFKMNAAELMKMTNMPCFEASQVMTQAASLANMTKQPVFITMAEQGIIGSVPGELAVQIPAFPISGAIDIVGAGDAVTANLAVALAAKATQAEAMQLAMAAASVVIHQLGTTGTASLPQIAALISTE